MHLSLLKSPCYLHYEVRGVYTLYKVCRSITSLSFENILEGKVFRV